MNFKKLLITTTLFISVAFMAQTSFAQTFIAGDISDDTGNSRGVSIADIDGDGDMDIYVANYNDKNILWINDGEGNFTLNNISDDTLESVYSTIADIDGDGDMDIYVTNNNNQQNILWINDGEGNFTLNNISDDTGWSRISSIADIDGDDDMDIYVTNDTNQQNILWINNGDGTFTSNNISGDIGNSYDSSIADLNGDGYMDIYVTNDANQQNNLWLGNGDGNFISNNISGDIGRSRSSSIADLNGDGYMDIYVININQQNKIWLQTTPNLQSESDTGASTIDNLTNDNTPSFDVQCSEAGIINLFFDEVNRGNHTCTGTEIAEITSSTLDDGIYDVTTRTFDGDGNEITRSSPVTVTIDTTPPEITLNTLTKISKDPITDTTVRLTDDYGIDTLDVALSLTQTTGAIEIITSSCLHDDAPEC